MSLYRYVAGKDDLLDGIVDTVMGEVDLVEHVQQHLAPQAGEGATGFEFGLDLTLDGLERLRRTS